MFRVPTGIGFIIILVFLIPTFWFGIISWQNTVKVYSQWSSGSDVVNPGRVVSSEEKTLIDQWIIANNLNEFGDVAGTVYAGGTPLFNELTQQTINKYDYIISKHPDRPWKK